MKCRIASFLACLMLCFAAQATSIRNPAAPLTHDTYSEIMVYDELMAEKMQSFRQYTEVNKRIATVVSAIDMPFDKLGYSLDKTFLASIKVNDTDVVQANQIRRMGFYDLFMPIIRLMGDADMRQLLMDEGYISQETVEYWLSRQLN